MAKMPDVKLAVTSDFKKPGDVVYVLGLTRPELGGSEMASELGISCSQVPQVDLVSARERYLTYFKATQGSLVNACHDCSDGGLGVALAEMCIAGGTGAEIILPAGNAVPSHAFLYGEDQARYLVASSAPKDLIADAEKAGVPAALLGYSGGDSLMVKDLVSLKLSDIKAAHEAWLPAYMNTTD